MQINSTHDIADSRLCLLDKLEEGGPLERRLHSVLAGGMQEVRVHRDCDDERERHIYMQKEVPAEVPAAENMHQEVK
jgi:hypothetical protein